MKNKQRAVHIKNRKYIYVIDKPNRLNEPNEIRIYDSKKKMYRINSEDLGTARIKPSDIKKYIEENILNQEA